MRVIRKSKMEGRVNSAETQQANQAVPYELPLALDDAGRGRLGAAPV